MSKKSNTMVTTVDMFSLAKSMAEMAEIDTSTAGDLTRVTFDPDMQWVGMSDKEVKAYKAAFDLVTERDKVAMPAMCLAMGQALLNAMDDSESSSGTVELYGERKLTMGFGVAKEGEARAVGISLEEPSAISSRVARWRTSNESSLSWAINSEMSFDSSLGFSSRPRSMTSKTPLL